MLLHGEQYLEIRKYPILTSGTLISYSQLVEVLDKSNAAVVVVGTTSKDASTGEDVFYSESSSFIRGSGGFGGPSKSSRSRISSSQYSGGKATTSSNNNPPARPADATVDEKTSTEQAALYRLNGDRNPLHIDPAFSTMGGFPNPILHGLCFLAFSAKHVYQRYGAYINVKARFAGAVVPGQTLRTEMWLVDHRGGEENKGEGGGGEEGKRKKVIFQTRVLETDKLCIVAAAAELLPTTAG